MGERGGMARARERGNTHQLRPLHFFHRQNYLNSLIYTNQPIAQYYLQFYILSSGW